MPQIVGAPPAARYISARGRLWLTAAQTIPNTFVPTQLNFDTGAANSFWAAEAFSETPGAFRPRRHASYGGGSYSGPLHLLVGVAWSGTPTWGGISIWLILDSGPEIMLADWFEGPRWSVVSATCFITPTSRIVVRVRHASATDLNVNPLGSNDEFAGLTVVAWAAPY